MKKNFKGMLNLMKNKFKNTIKLEVNILKLMNLKHLLNLKMKIIKNKFKKFINKNQKNLISILIRNSKNNNNMKMIFKNKKTNIKNSWKKEKCIIKMNF